MGSLALPLIVGALWSLFGLAPAHAEGGKAEPTAIAWTADNITAIRGKLKCGVEIIDGDKIIRHDVVGSFITKTGEVRFRVERGSLLGESLLKLNEAPVVVLVSSKVDKDRSLSQLDFVAVMKDAATADK